MLTFTIPTSPTAGLGNLDPFETNQLGTRRFQVIYRANQFPRAGNITSIAYRVESSTSNTGSITYDIRFNLAYSANNVGSASTTFASNIGSGLTTCFDGTVTLSATGTLNPNPFDLHFDFTTPFFYNPANGPLLVEMLNRTSPAIGGPSSDNNNFSDFTGPYQRIYANPYTATTGDTDAISAAPVTQFQLLPGPDPVNFETTGNKMLSFGGQIFCVYQ